jgi:hypothetical protein
MLGGELEDPPPGAERGGKRAVAHASGERVAPGELDKAGVGGAHAFQPRQVGAVGDELGGAADQLDQVGGQFTTSRCLPTAGPTRERAGQRRHGKPAGEQASSQHEPCDGQQGGGGANRDCARKQRH